MFSKMVLPMDPQYTNVEELHTRNAVLHNKQLHYDNFKNNWHGVKPRHTHIISNDHISKTKFVSGIITILTRQTIYYFLNIYIYMYVYKKRSL